MKARLYSRRYLKQITLTTISLLLILCTIFIAILYMNAFNSTTKTIANSEFQRTKNLLSQSDTYLEQLRSICTAFAKLNIPYNELLISENYWARNTFNSMLESHTAANTYIENIDVKINGNSMSPSDISHQKQLGEFSVFELYTQEISSWPYFFDLTSTYEGQLNTVTMTINAYQLSRQLFTYDETQRLDFLLTKEGNILLTNQKSFFFLDVERLYPGILSAQSETMKELMQSYDEYYYVLSTPDKYGFQILSMFPKSFYSHQFTTILLHTLLMACGLLLITLLISIFLIIRFYRPINTMVTLLRTYIQDDLHDYENEIAFIYDNITKYVTPGKEAKSLLPQTLTQLHNVQTAVLQYQINSHFLFNTLENIKVISITELGIDNEIENYIMLLNTIIREGIVQKTSIIPLSHELHLAKCYLELMQLRFPDVESYFSVDESLLQCSVFKFSLQPLLENCFSHAFNGDTGRPKHIHISVFNKDNNLAITIKDNGYGLNDVSMKELEQLLRSDTESDQPHHVGIRNVHERITNVFGVDYGITIESTPPGITVTILYPITPLF